MVVIMILQLSPTNNNINELIPESELKGAFIVFWGDVGVGKTTLSLCASLSVLVSGKKVIYINTRPNFKYERFSQLKSSYKDFNKQYFILYNAETAKQLVKIIMRLEFLFLEEIRLLGRSSIGLVVLDTATTLFHVEMKSKNFNEKLQGDINNTLATLQFLATKYNIPVIVTDRLIRTYNDSGNNNTKPANERTISYFSTHLLKIERTENAGERILLLQKNPKNLPKQIRTQLIRTGFD
ncbi:MAG: hypothetical protein GF364_16685 [Candidatus Lokiarchaeota archaeon]|nr:hypothetical protein [Candidatus Lokiarchaeota archaeon]